MLWSITCNSNECANKGVEYLMPKPDADVMCGGCKTMISPIITNISYIPITYPEVAN